MQLWRLFGIPKRIERLETRMDELIAEIAEIKTAFDTFKANVATKIAELEAAITTNDTKAVKEALDGLKADVEAATV